MKTGPIFISLVGWGFSMPSWSVANEREGYVFVFSVSKSPVDGVEYFGAFFERERSVFVFLCSCVLNKMPVETL